MNHGELFKVVLRWPCFDVFRSPFSVLSFVSVPVFQFCVLKFYRFEIAHLRRFRACFQIKVSKPWGEIRKKLEKIKKVGGKVKN